MLGRRYAKNLEEKEMATVGQMGTPFGNYSSILVYVVWT
jgi:hypothetical protein